MMRPIVGIPQKCILLSMLLLAADNIPGGLWQHFAAGYLF